MSQKTEELASAVSGVTMPVLRQLTLGSLLGDVRRPVAEMKLAIDVLADNGRAIRGDAVRRCQSHTRRDARAKLLQDACDPLHAHGRTPQEGFNSVAKGIAAPANHLSLIGDSIRKALIGGGVRESAQ